MVMDQILKRKVCEEHSHVENVYLLTEYVGCKEDIINPLGGALADYGECYETLEKLVSKLVVLLNEQELMNS